MSNCIPADDFDLDMLQDAHDIMKDKFPDMLRAYIEDCQTYLEQIKLGIQDKNADMVAQNSHPLKSSSASLGIEKLANIAKKIETSSKAHLQTSLSPDMDDMYLTPCIDAMPELEKAVDDACLFLTKTYNL